MKACAVAFAVVSCITAQALAADLPLSVSSPPLPIPASYSWTGWYAGLQLGGAWERSDWRLFSQTGSGLLYGGHIGFNYQFDQFVLGGEGDFTGSTVKADSICAAVAGTNCRTTVDYLASLRAKAGIALDRLMAYADGGVAFGGFRFAQTAGLQQSWANTVHVGWTAGAGLEYAFTDHLTGGVEYNFYGFPSQSLGGGINPVTIPPHEWLNSVVGKASYKF